MGHGKLAYLEREHGLPALLVRWLGQACLAGPSAAGVHA